MTTASDFSAELAPESPLPSQSNFAMTWVDYFRPVTFAFWAMHLAAIAGVAYVGFSLARPGAGDRHLLRPHGRGHRRLPPLLLAPRRSRPRARSSSCWRSARRARRRRACSGGPATTAGTTSTRTRRTDVHSARQRGFWYSHVGWILSPRLERDRPAARSPTWRSFPELRFLEPRRHLRPARGRAGAGLCCFWAACTASSGASSSRPCCSGTARSRSTRWRTCSAGGATRPTDDSRNNWLLALLTTGEGWHNNHHHYQSSANQGFRWWEIDVTYYVLRLLALLRPRSGTCAARRPR